MKSPLPLHRPGRVDYRIALDWQRAAVAELRGGDGAERLAILEHDPVYTLGRRTRRKHFLVPPAELRARGASVVDVDRGGDVTFHGPGQLVAYPILDLRRRDLGAADYVRALEQAVIETMARFGVDGERVVGRPGVWADGAKVAAVGVRVQGGVSSHGLALNVSTDLSWFDAIVPCGLRDAGVTSLERLLCAAPHHGDAEREFAAAFARVFDVELRELVDEPFARSHRELVAASGR
jgi:lipoate-protein ligase B